MTKFYSNYSNDGGHCNVLDTFFIFYNSDPNESATINLDNFVANAIESDKTNRGFTSYDGPSPGVPWEVGDDPCATKYAFSGYRANGLVGVSAFNKTEAPAGYDEFTYSGGNLIIAPYSTVALRGGYFNGITYPNLNAQGGVISPGYNSNLTAVVKINFDTNFFTEKEFEKLEPQRANYWDNITNKPDVSTATNVKIAGTGQELFRINGGGAEPTTRNMALYLTSKTGTVNGTAFADTLHGKKDLPNFMYGKRGNDKIKGGDYGDLMIGGPGRDEIIGKGGDDWIEPGPGRDKISPGPGRDKIHWDVVTGEVDRVIGFNSSEDILSFGLKAFGDLAYNKLMQQAELKLSATGRAVGNDAQFVWSPVESMLSFDYDGEGGAEPFNIAKLDAAPTLQSMVFAQKFMNPAFSQINASDL